eukprot:scaffold167640_cov19-Prasinocladus_malaysianus.AAC.1
MCELTDERRSATVPVNGQRTDVLVMSYDISHFQIKIGVLVSLQKSSGKMDVCLPVIAHAIITFNVTMLHMRVYA